MNFGELGLEKWESPRILLFTVDDAQFGVHLDWVEAVYQRDSVQLHTVRTARGCLQQFVLHGQEPAFRVELREAFDLREMGSAGERSAHLVVRSGSYLLAVQVDACVGVRQLPVGPRPPIPTSVIRDGGMPVGHLVGLDGHIVTVLDPSRLLDGVARDGLAAGVREAAAFQDRERQIEVLWSDIRQNPSVAAVRKYARLSRRNGRVKTASAARMILKHLQQLDAGESPDRPGTAERNNGALILDMLAFDRQQRSGDLVVEGQEGADVGRLVFRNGRLVNAYCGSDEGRHALTQLLGLSGTLQRMEASSEEAVERLADSTVALAIEGLALHSAERRRRQSA